MKTKNRWRALELKLTHAGFETRIAFNGEEAWGKTVPVIILTNLTSENEQRMRDVTETEPSYYLLKTDWKIEDIVAKVKERLGYYVKSDTQIKT